MTLASINQIRSLLYDVQRVSLTSNHSPNKVHGRQTIHQIRFIVVNEPNKVHFFLIGQVILYKSMAFLIFDHISLMASVGNFFWSNFSNFYDFLPSHNSQMAMIKQMFKADVKKITGEEPMETPLGDGFTIYSGGALGSDSVAEFAALELGMNVEIKIPPGHPRVRSVSPLTPPGTGRGKPLRGTSCQNAQPIIVPTSHQQLQEQSRQAKFPHRAGSRGRVCIWAISNHHRPTNSQRRHWMDRPVSHRTV